MIVSSLGYPRIGPRRELKHALEAFWAGDLDRSALLQRAAGLRAEAWARQLGAGISQLPSNDFSLYDHVLDTAVMVGAIPARYGWTGGEVDLGTYFALARGDEDVTALELTKWFDTNYHYLVPELASRQDFTLAATKPIDEYRQAKSLGFETRPVLLGPITFLLLAKVEDGSEPLDLLPRLLPVYADVLRRLGEAGAAWVQLDEPALVLDLDAGARSAYEVAYAQLAEATSARLLLAAYYGELDGNLETALSLPVAGLHVDLVRGRRRLEDLTGRAPAGLTLSLGVVDGRNVWATDLRGTLELLEPVAAQLGLDRLQLGPSCPLLHVPLDVELETGLDPELRGWLAFAVQKLDELATLGRALDEGREAVAAELEHSDRIVAARRSSPLIHSPSVAARLAAVTPELTRRRSGYGDRARAQASLGLPALPTTTIGSLPQTAEIRHARAAHAGGELDGPGYEAFLRDQTERAVRWQDDIGLDVLVHGEFERNDMVQYFGEQLDGFAFTSHGWVQSYGSRCVRPPIVYGDVSRPEPMTVKWSTYAQSLTAKPMKAMLTGPVTMLQWSFVRDDLPRADVCRQIALALRDEVHDLEAAGIRVIQIDEPALREGLPLRAADRAAYLDWAVEAFRLASSGVADATQVHTHMCYSDFNEIIDAIAALDADVISIESARSHMELLDAFRDFDYPNEIGPGVYDIHSPRVPSTDEIEQLLAAAERRIPRERLWVNPDCGLKTRTWEQVRPALEHLVEAARRRRAEPPTAAASRFEAGDDPVESQ